MDAGKTYNWVTGIFTSVALWANTTGNLSGFLTLVISCLSIVLLLLKIIEKLPMLYERYQQFKQRYFKNKKDGANT